MLVVPAEDGKYVPLIDTTKSEGDCANNPDPQHCYYPCYDHRTMADLLDPLPRQPSDPPNWRYYARKPEHIFTAPNAIPAICGPAHSSSCHTGTWGDDWNNLVFPEDRSNDKGAILTDIANCDLAKVSWVIPDGHWSDHPGDMGEDGGPSWVAAIVNAIGNSWTLSKGGGQCDYWGNHTSKVDATAIIVVWDNWGGWYDHVPPLNIGYLGGQGSQYVYGFRVPLLVVSRFTPQHVSNVNHDFGNILNFIEYVFGTGGVSIGEINGAYHFADFFAPDGQPPDYSLSDFFNFSSPRGFSTILGAKYPPDCFHNPGTSGCFGTDFADAEPDNDDMDNY